jgi:hypothetical protein
VIRVASFTTVGEAEAARSALDAAGIDAVLADERIVAVHWLYSQALGGVKVLVAAEDGEEALGILTEIAAAPTAEDSEPEGGELWSGVEVNARGLHAPPPTPSDTAGLRCPRCGKHELHYIRYRRFKCIPLLFTILIVLVLPVSLLLPKKRCDHCGKRTWV